MKKPVKKEDAGKLPLSPYGPSPSLRGLDSLMVETPSEQRAMLLERRLGDHLEEVVLRSVSPQEDSKKAMQFLQKAVESMVMPFAPEAKELPGESSRMTLRKMSKEELAEWEKALDAQLREMNVQTPRKTESPQERKEQELTQAEIDKIARRVIREAMKSLDVSLDDRQFEYAVKVFKTNYKLYQQRQEAHKLSVEPEKIALIAKLSVLCAAGELKKSIDLLEKRQLLGTLDIQGRVELAPPSPSPKEAAADGKQRLSKKERKEIAAAVEAMTELEDTNLALYGASASGGVRQLGDMRLLVVVGNLFAAPDFNPNYSVSGSGLDQVAEPQFSRMDPLGRNEIDVVRALQRGDLQADLERKFEGVVGETKQHTIEKLEAQEALAVAQAQAVPVPTSRA